MSQKAIDTSSSSEDSPTAGGNNNTCATTDGAPTPMAGATPTGSVVQPTSGFTLPNAATNVPVALPQPTEVMFNVASPVSPPLVGTEQADSQHPNPSQVVSTGPSQTAAAEETKDGDGRVDQHMVDESQNEKAATDNSRRPTVDEIVHDLGQNDQDLQTPQKKRAKKHRRQSRNLNSDQPGATANLVSDGASSHTTPLQVAASNAGSSQQISTFDVGVAASNSSRVPDANDCQIVVGRTYPAER